ncbi:MAG: hypothetical protein H6Q33_5526 [Deltaproteobacteria bacterium]|nr:hypothetical protein [Deltaproteobacteria bacterium]
MSLRDRRTVRSDGQPGRQSSTSAIPIDAPPKALSERSRASLRLRPGFLKLDASRPTPAVLCELRSLPALPEAVLVPVSHNYSFVFKRWQGGPHRSLSACAPGLRNPSAGPQELSGIPFILFHPHTLPRE